MLAGGKLDKSTHIIETEDLLDDRVCEFSGDDFNVAFEITRP